MATLLDAPKPAPKYEHLVEKRFGEVRDRIRLLDYLSAGLWLLLGSMLFLFGVLVVDRYVETPTGAGWATVAIYLILAGGFLYWSLFRPSRRQINPYYVAKQVEATMANAKNSVVNWVDLHDDEKIDVAIRHAVSSRAGKDLKTVDIDRAIERKQLVWVGGFAILAFVFASIAYFLPPLRTKIELLQPEGGNATIFSTQDFRLAVGLKGRIPDLGHPDAARLRIWYNPDDLATYEDRPLEPSPDDRTKWEGFVSARQTRTGFTYQVLAGDAATPKYALTVRILPVIESYEVRYEYPEYINEKPKTVSDLNLIGYYGTKVTMTVHTNCELQSGQIQVNGGQIVIPATVSETDKQALIFQFPLEMQGRYRIAFTTIEGEKNTESPNPKMTLLDPTPMFTHFEVSYRYPAYLRWKDHNLTDIKKPEIDAIRGTRVVLTAHANRPIREAGLRFPEVAKILPGQGIPGKPQSIRFEFPPLDRDGEAQIWFSPTTNEKRIDPFPIKIKVRLDKDPVVEITKPEKEKVEIELPANGTLAVDGFATDDYGVKSMSLKMKVIAPVQQELAAKPYREGKNFVRPKDQSYPIRLDYKDSQKLGELKTLDGKPFPLNGGEIIEYWLEALDNCDVQPAPHKGESEHKRVKVLPPKKDEQNQQKQEQQDQNRKNEEKQNDQNQDQKNENEERNPNQPPPQGGEKGNPEKKEGQPEKKDGEPEKKEGEPNNQNGQPDKKGGQPEKKGGEPEKNGGQPENNGGQPEKKNGQNGEGERSEEQTKQDAQDLQNKLDQQKGQDKPGPQNDQKQPPEKPAEPKPEGNGNKSDAGENKPQPQPNQEGGGAGDKKPEGKVEPTPKSEQKGDGNSQPGMNEAGEPKPEQGGGTGGRAENKPQGKPEPKGQDGANGQKEKDPGVGKGDGNQKRPDADPMKPENQEKVAAGGNKPEPKEGRGQEKPVNSEPQAKQQPPQDVASNKAEKSEKPAETKPTPNPMKGTDPGENKQNLAKKEDKTDPQSKEEGAAKPEGKQGPKQDETAKGSDKPDGPPEKKNDANGAGGKEQAKKDPPPKIDPKDLRDLANELKDPMKREEALKKIQDLAGDKKASEEAKKQFDEMMKNTNEQEKKEIADAMKDLEKAIKGNDNGASDKEGPKETAKNDPKTDPAQSKPSKPESKKDNPNAKEGKQGQEGSAKPGPDEGKQEIASKDKPNQPVDPKNQEPKKGDPKERDPKLEGKEPGKELAKEGQPKEKPKGDRPPEGEAKPNQPGEQGEKIAGGDRKQEPKNVAEEETSPLIADKKNQLKAGQMQLEKFKANEKLLREQKNWGDKEWADFINARQQMLNKQQEEITQMEKQGSRSTGPSALNSSERIKLDERKGSDPLAGSKFVAPPGFGDPYKQFTGDLSGAKKK